MLKQSLRSALMVALLAAICTSFSTAQAAPGDLDPTFAGFDGDGMVEANFLGGRSMALQPDGKIVIAGAAVQPGSMAVRRYLPNGQPDNTFGGDGEVTIPAPIPIALYINPQDVAVQADGKIVVAGYNTSSQFDNTSSFLLIRLTTSGQLDPSFGNQGVVLTDFSNGPDVARKVLIQPDGQIVAAGVARVPKGNFWVGDFALARYNPTGSPDMTFGVSGKVTIYFDNSDDDAYDIALQPNGKLVVVGKSIIGNDYDFAIARLNPTGTLDDNSDGDGGFSGDGKLTTGFGANDGATAVAIQADGRIVVTGTEAQNNFEAFPIDNSFIARYLPNGNPDNSLDGDGKLTLPNDVLKELALQPDGKLVLFGYTYPDDKFAFHRLLPGGTHDPTFDYDGIAWLDSKVTGRDVDLSLLPDGRILAAGSVQGFTTRLVRLWPDGTFDTGGQQTHGLAFAPNYQPGYQERVNGMALQANGSFLVAGQVYNRESTVSDAFVTRFKPDGLPDTAFGTNGSAYLFSPGLFRAARAVAVQPDGKIVIAGYSAFNTQQTIMDFLVARFLPGGGIDFNFGTGGVALVDFVGRADSATALALAPDGKIVVAGPIQGSRYIWGVVRLTSSGQPDPSFGGGGKAYVDFNSPNMVNAVVVQPDGKIILGGYRESNGDSDFALARLTASGALDSSFGATAQGLVITQLGGTDRINALALAPNGFIYAGGYREIAGNQDFALVQYKSNGLRTSCTPGSPCSNWPTGRYVSGLGGDDFINALALRADGQLVAAGCSEGHFGGVQLRTDGDPIPTQLMFNTDFVGSPDCAKGVKFVGANQIIMAGDQAPYPFISGDSNIALARYETTVNNPVPTPAPPPGSNFYPVYLPIIVR